MMPKWYRKFPPSAVAVLKDYKAWLIGSAAKWVLDSDPAAIFPNDIDILVPYASWKAVSRLVRSSGEEIKVNTFGGLKLITVPSMDIWPGSLDELFEDDPTATAVRFWPRAIVRGAQL